MPGDIGSRGLRRSKVAGSAQSALIGRYAALDPEGLPDGARFFILETENEKIAVVSFPEVDPLLPAANGSSSVFTAAELAILRQLLLGHSNITIARARRRSARTVAHQVASIFRKVGVGSRRELLATLRGGQSAPTTALPKRVPRGRDP